MAKDRSLSMDKVQKFDSAILEIRGQRVMLDSELATVYGVTTGRLNQQVRRNLHRFPADFVFQISPEEFKALMLQNAASKKGRGGRRKLPLAFTELGAPMAASPTMIDWSQSGYTGADYWRGTMNYRRSITEGMSVSASCQLAVPPRSASRSCWRWKRSQRNTNIAPRRGALSFIETWVNIGRN